MTKEPFGTGFDTLICFNFYKGWQAINAFYSHFLPEGTSPQQSYILEACDPDKATTVSDIVTQLDSDKSAISNMLKRMDAAGLIRREVVPTNRRMTYVFLTKKGVQLKNEVRRSMKEADRVLSNALTQSEKSSLFKMVSKIKSL